MARSIGSKIQTWVYRQINFFVHFYLFEFLLSFVALKQQVIDPLGIIPLKGCHCKLIDIDYLAKPIEQKNEPETKSVVFAIIRNKDSKMLHYFKCKTLDIAQKWVNLINLISKQITSVNLYIERTLKYTHSTPNVRNPDCVGYLGKKSAKTGVYKPRYFILKDACLYFLLEIASNAIQGKLSVCLVYFNWPRLQHRHLFDSNNFI